jgi:hypothetical protein
MTTIPQKSPDWFDRWWDSHCSTFPIMLRGEIAKKSARGILSSLIENMGAEAKTPEGVRSIIAFARITAIMQGATGVLDAPNPSPEQIADAVERLVQRMKP